MANHPDSWNRGKMLYLPDYYVENVGGESDSPNPRVIDTTNLELLSIQFVPGLTYVEENSYVEFSLWGTNDRTVHPFPVVSTLFGRVPLKPDRVDFFDSVTVSAAGDVRVDVAGGTSAIAYYSKLPRYVELSFVRDLISGEEPNPPVEGFWKINIYGWMV